MKYLIGMDGGGTKTKCVITDFNFNILHQCIGGPSNFLMIGTERVSESILSLIIECLDILKITANEIEAILIGTTGAGRVEDAQKLKNDFSFYTEAKGYKFKSFNVDSDARIALEGAFSGKPGALLIAGTGSIIFGKDKNNNIHRVGGFGRLIGDEGSGTTLGRKGLNQIAKEFDGRGDKTLMTEYLKNVFGISDSSQMITEVYRNNFDVASFAPRVIDAAKQGDKAAINILEEETNELLLHVKAISNLIGEKSFKLCLVGGTISKENTYSMMFRNKLEQQIPGVKIVDAENPPEMGAVYMAKSLSI